MLHRFGLVLIGLFIALVTYNNAGAFTVTYTPAPLVLMTGATSVARFDVAEVLYNSGMEDKIPKFNTTAHTFTGVFYINSIGWIEFSTGTYQVGLDCGGQYLSGLTSNCYLTGTGWSEMVGDVDFSNVEYLTGGELSGSVSTYAGDFSLSGIYLPLKPVELNESMNTLMADSSRSFSVSGASQYAYSSTGWELEHSPISGTLPRISVGDANGVFSGVDISYADDYELIFTDPSGSETKFSPVMVSSNVLSNTLDTTPTNLIHNFCSTYPSSCPDGATLETTSLTRDGINLIADGKSYYNFQIKTRDQYGNKINSGEISIRYNGTISSVQIHTGDMIGPLFSPWSPSFIGDALIFSGQTLSPDFSGKWETPIPVALLGADIRYGVASTAPTDGVANTLSLDAIIYTSPTGVTSTISDPTQITFDPPYESDMSGPSIIRVGEENLFQNTVTKDTSENIIPEVFSLFSIGSGANAAFRDFVSPEMIECQAFPQDLILYSGKCDWMRLSGNDIPSVFITQTGGTFSFSGLYAPFTTYPVAEGISYGTYIHYETSSLGLPGTYLGSIDILYPSKTGSFGTSEYRTSKVELLGQNNARGEYGTIGTNKINKTKFLDTIRKNTALLSRNRTDNYVGVPYIIGNTDFTVTGGTFDDKRTIVVVGGDITISQNIGKKDVTLAVIALTDHEGNGGNIYINGSVTDINASLIAEHSIFNSGVDDHQLYIYGSVISANTLGDTAAQICPYYVTNCNSTEAAKYDFENFRSGYDGTHVSDSLTATKYPDNALIIEYDIRIQQNPPPVVQ